MSTTTRTQATRLDSGGVSLRVHVPSPIAEAYELEAEKRGVDLETVMSERLVETVDYTAHKPLYFNDDERQQLEQVVGKNLSSTREALGQIRNLGSVRVQGVKVGIKVNVLERLKSRCLRTKWETFLEKLITEDLERYVGLR